MDGGKKSYDTPPPAQSERPTKMGHVGPDQGIPEPQEDGAPQLPPNLPVDPDPDHPTDSARNEASVTDVATPAAGPTSHAVGRLTSDDTVGPSDATESVPYVAKLIPVSPESLQDIPDDRPQRGAGRLASDDTVGPSYATESVPYVAKLIPVSPESLQDPLDDGPQRGAGNHESEVMSRPLKIAYASVLGMLAVSLLGLVYVHLLHHSDNAHTTQQTAPPTTSAHVTTTLAHTTTTTALPTTLSPSAVAAASALVSAWSTNNRSAALEVATPTAAATLFGVPYTGGLAIDRGCSTSFSPIVCTYGPPGGASPTDPIYQIMVSQAQGGWYVSSVKIEN